MSLLAEAAFQTAAQPDTPFAELVTQPVGGGEGLLPALMAPAVEQIELGRWCLFEEDTWTPSRRTSAPLFQFLRNKFRICSKISVSSWVGEASEWARVIVVKSL